MNLPSIGEVLDAIWRRLAFPPSADETTERYTCWLWQGAVGHNEAPTLRVRGTDGKLYAISPGRYIWQLEFQRKLSKHTHVRRTCGNPRCINPYHGKVSDDRD
jgi:hypothetical protein